MNKLTKIILIVAVIIILAIVILVVQGFNIIDSTIAIKNQMQDTTDSYSVNIADELEDNGITTNYENVKIEVVEDSISSTGVTILITDPNSYGWGEDYEIETKKDNEWEIVEPNKRVIVNAIAHCPDENNQLELNIDWDYYYGKLENGIYRIVKSMYDGTKLYSNEFEISE